MARYDLTDFEWSVIEPLLPQKSRGVPRVDDRGVLNGIFWLLRSGPPSFISVWIEPKTVNSQGVFSNSYPGTAISKIWQAILFLIY